MDKKAHKMNKQMVNVLSNLNTVMCRIFIKVQSLMPQKVNISYSNFDEQTMVNNQKIVEKWQLVFQRNNMKDDRF
jgi:hypothetical protein